MKKFLPAIIFTTLALSLNGCAKTATAATGVNQAGPSSTPGIATATATLPPGVVPTPSLAPDAWESMPVIPVVSETAKNIYQQGQALGNDPHAFSIVGDCLSLATENSPNFFVNYDKPGHYNLGDYTDLQPVIDWFLESFGRQSISLGDGFNSATVLSPLRSDPKQCLAGETPLECEYRIFHPSYAIISLGTDDYKSTTEVFEGRMRQIVDYTISQGIVPILVTKADNREGGNAFNELIARLAYEYDVPLWNFWRAVKPLPFVFPDEENPFVCWPLSDGVIKGNQGHLCWADGTRLDQENAMQIAIPVRNLTGLQTLQAVWQGVTAP